MVKRFGYALIVIWLAVPVRAEIREETAPGSAAAPAVPSTSFFTRDRFSYLVGASIFKGEVAPALAVRAALPKQLQLELGGSLPHPVSGYASDSFSGFIAPFQNDETAEVSSFAETHLALVYPLYQEARWSVEAGAGVSFAIVTDHLTQTLELGGGTSEEFASYHNQRILPSGMALLGAGVQLTEHLSFHLDASYVHYDHGDAINLQSFNLSFSGVILRPALLIKF
jgi:hypothetical protein